MIRQFLRVLIGSVLALLPATAMAYELPGGWEGSICEYIPCGGGGGAMGLTAYITETVVFALEIGFIAVAGIMLFISSITLVANGHEESAATEAKTGYAYTIAGGAVVALAHLIVQAFSPTETGSAVIDTEPLDTGFGNVIFYFRIVLSVVATVNLVYQGIRLIVAQEQGDIEKARKRVLQGFIGIGVVMLANAIIGGFVPTDPGILGAFGVQGNGSANLAFQIVGITNFLLAFFGFICLVSIIVAGVMLIISVDEGLKDKAKNIVKTSVTALAIILAAYVLVSTFSSSSTVTSVQTSLLQILIPSASAQSIIDTIGKVGGQLPAGFGSSGGGGGSGFVSIASFLVMRARPALIMLAVFVVVLTGFRMVLTQDEEIVTKGIKIISSCVTGVATSFLIGPFIDAFYGGYSTGAAAAVPRGNMTGGASIVQTEVYGFIRWILVIVGVVAVTVIVFSGLKAIFKGTGEEGITDMRRVVFGVIGGLMLIIFTQVINFTFGLNGIALPGNATPAPVLQTAVLIVQFFLGFLTLVAVVIIVYAGLVMILNFGNEEQFKKAKSLLLRGAVGFVVIIVSFIIIQFVIFAAFGVAN